VNEFYYHYGLDRKDSRDVWNYGGHINLRDERNFYNHRQIGRFQTSYCGLVADKYALGIYLTALGFPTPRILALFDRDGICWAETWKKEPLETILERENLDVFAKEVLGGGGRDVFPLQVQEGKLILAKQNVTVGEFWDKLYGRYILQQRVKQHPAVSRLYPNSVNTIRLVTILRGTIPEVLGAGVRVGIGGNYVDNLHCGGLVGGIDLPTGRLSRYFIEGNKYRKLTHHPDTKEAFGEITYPFVPEAVQLCLRIHSFFYGMHSVGWDVALSEEGPVILEANDEWDFPLLQMVNGGLKERFHSYRPAKPRKGWRS